MQTFKRSCTNSFHGLKTLPSSKLQKNPSATLVCNPCCILQYKYNFNCLQAWNKLLRNIATIYTAAGVLWCFSFFNHWHFRWSSWLLEFNWFGCLYCSYDAVGIWVILFTSHGVNLLPVKEYFKKASVSCRRQAITGIVKFSCLWRTEGWP